MTPALRRAVAAWASRLATSGRQLTPQWRPRLRTIRSLGLARPSADEAQLALVCELAKWGDDPLVRELVVALGFTAWADDETQERVVPLLIGQWYRAATIAVRS